MEAYHHAQAAAVAEFKNMGVPVSDPLEAAVACPDCLSAHCPALSSRGPRIIRVQRPFDPNSDSQQTSGNTTSEGDE